MLRGSAMLSCHFCTVHFSFVEIFTKKFGNLAKHSQALTRLYGCGRNWGCKSLRQKNPAVAAAGQNDTHIFPAVSPETLVSRREYSHRYRVSTALKANPAAQFCPERKGKGDTHENQFDSTNHGTFGSTGDGRFGVCQTSFQDY